MKDTALVFDCGATNVRVIAVNSRGDILACESVPNNTAPDPLFSGGKIWDTDDIWQKMCNASLKVMKQINPKDIAGVTVTTFGVDGTLFSADGTRLYPVISWQCDRTAAVMNDIEKYISLDELYSIAGVLPFSFNTINKLIWFRENRPDLAGKSKMFLFMPSIFSFYLTGEMANDTTMAGTSMVSSLKTRGWSGRILNAVSFPSELLGLPVEPGTVTGKTTKKASSLTGIPEGTPVVATGHDTQFAIFGSGAGVNEPVLSSGTWEILMARSASFTAGPEQLKSGITTELDAISGLYNIGNQWIASGMLEWARKVLYKDVKENVYETMISGAEAVPPGSGGVKIVPKFYEEIGGRQGGGVISGLTMDTSRDQIYRAMLEALSARLKDGKDALEMAGGFRASSILCVGGGSKNRLWNKLRADYTGVPVRVTDKSETTVLGASLFVQYAAGNAPSPEEARRKINYNEEIYYPNK
jgi:L-fuculokinase